MNKILFLAMSVLVSINCFATKIQQQGFVNHTDCSNRGVSDSVCVLLDSQVWDSTNNQLLSASIPGFGGSSTIHAATAYYAETNGSWTYSVSTTVVDPASTGSMTFTQDNNTNMTITAYKSGANFLPGFNFTAVSGKWYHISATTTTVASANSSISYVELNDGSTGSGHTVGSMTVAFGSGSPNGTPLTIAGDYLATSSGTVTIRFQIAANVTWYIGAAEDSSNDLNNHALRAMTFSIHQID